MLHSKSKNIILIINFIGLCFIMENKTIEPSITYQELNAHNNQIHAINIATQGIIFTTLSLTIFIKGILDAYNIPVTAYDTLALASRNNMDKNTLNNTEFGMKLKSRSEIIIGLLGTFISFFGTIIGIQQLTK